MLNVALDKARAAIDAARALLETAEPDTSGLIKVKDSENYSRLISAANVNVPRSLISRAARRKAPRAARDW